MKDERLVVNPFFILSPKLDSEAERLQDLHNSPVSDSLSPEQGLLIMISKLIEINRILSKAVVLVDDDLLAACERLCDEVHQQEELVTSNLVQSCNSIGQNLFRLVVRFPCRLERIGDMFQNMLTCCRIKQKNGIPFSDKALGDLAQIFGLTGEMLINIRDSLMIRNKSLLKHIASERERVMRLLEEARFGHWDRIEAGFCAPAASSLYLDILDSFTAINQYIGKIADSLLDIDKTQEQPKTFEA